MGSRVVPSSSIAPPVNFLRCYYIKSIISSSITMTLCLDFDVLHGIYALNSHDDDTWKTVLAGDLGTYQMTRGRLFWRETSLPHRTIR